MFGSPARKDAFPSSLAGFVISIPKGVMTKEQEDKMFQDLKDIQDTLKDCLSILEASNTAVALKLRLGVLNGRTEG